MASWGNRTHVSVRLWSLFDERILTLPLRSSQEEHERSSNTA
jgi:hypothetical protein